MDKFGHGRRVTSAFAFPPLTPSLSPEYRGDGVIFRSCFRLLLGVGLLVTLAWAGPHEILVYHPEFFLPGSAGASPSRPGSSLSR